MNSEPMIEGRPSFTCPRCGATSHHPCDAREGYCGRCHDWTGEGISSARELAQEVLDRHAGRIGTHYHGCWRSHIGCFAKLMLDTLPS